MKTLVSSTAPTYSSFLAFAKNVTKESASVPDCFCTDTKKTAFRNLAQLLAKDKGYIIATPSELVARYPELYTAMQKRIIASESRKTTPKSVWAIASVFVLINGITEAVDFSFCQICHAN